MTHRFQGKWISNEVMANLQPRNVFHRQLDKQDIDCSKHRNQHILFRKKFMIGQFQAARIFISADDYYKLYINGKFVAQGPAPSYHFQYHYNEINVSDYLMRGENTIAVHTLYQGLINRVWQSGDHRHGMICDLVVDKKTVLISDETFLTANHTGYSELDVTGKHQTQFLERYDSRAAEVGFALPDFDDSVWKNAHICRFDDHVMTEQKSHTLEFEEIEPKEIHRNGSRILYDFGANYVGYLCVTANGNTGDRITIRHGQELEADGSLRFDLRANCKYEEDWILSDGLCKLDQFDYKVFRYAELIIPDSATVSNVSFHIRHYPFCLHTSLKSEYQKDPDLQKIWELCIHTQKYGVQEVIQDCMDREKGFYLGDGCYTALTHTVLSNDDSMLRKLIDDAFSTDFITDTLVTCLDCSFMQEIAEYPLILVSLVLWHYRWTHDKEYLEQNYHKIVRLLEAYRREYEQDGLLRNLDKWCVVEWPAGFRHGYDADLTEGQICREAHVSINAYYLCAIRTANTIANLLGKPHYREASPLLNAFYQTFFDPVCSLFKDSERSHHISLVGNSFVYGFGLYPNDVSRQAILKLYDQHGMQSLSFFCTFPMLCGFVRDNDEKRLLSALKNEGTWKRMLREGATTTFEGWGKETKKNASLFHLTMSFAALFLADINLKDLLA